MREDELIMDVAVLRWSWLRLEVRRKDALFKTL